MTDDTRLRSEIDSLVGVGLTEDEAYLIAKRRLGTSDGGDSTGRGGIGGALILALVSAVAVKTPLLFGVDMDRDDFFVPNLGLFAFVPLIVFFAWRRAVPIRTAVLMLGVPVLVLATAANAFAFAYLSQTSLLSAITTPVALWFVVGLAYVGGDWRDHERRMDFVRFSGEWFIYYVLIALGGGVLLALTIGAFSMLGLNAEGAVMAWVMLPGAMGAVIVAAWLVEAKQSVVENMAPVLTRRSPSGSTSSCSSTCCGRRGCCCRSSGAASRSWHWSAGRRHTCRCSGCGRCSSRSCSRRCSGSRRRAGLRCCVQTPCSGTVFRHRARSRAAARRRQPRRPPRRGTARAAAGR